MGELTNVAALLESEPGIAKKIRAISLMGGSVYRGYAAGSKPEPATMTGAPTPEKAGVTVRSPCGGSERTTLPWSTQR